MIASTLKEDFDSILENAHELWFAIALVNDLGFDYIQNKLQNHCKQSYLVGIDLPTSPSVLKKMQSKLINDSFRSGIFKFNANYHPKVYLFKIAGNFIAFIGSSNLTNGGLKNNIELNYKVTNQKHCRDVLTWFENHFKNSYPLTDENIFEYEKQFDTIELANRTIKQSKSSIKLTKRLLHPKLDAIDFSNNFFKEKDHLAFRKALWFSDSAEAIHEREIARDKFLKLHYQIFSKFKDYGIQVLQPNPMENHLISMIRQIDQTKPRAINAMWLSYGKKESDIKLYQKIVGQDQKAKQTFIHHARLQIRIDIENIGIWLLFAKENEGSIFDRSHFREKMRNLEYRNHFYDMIKSLSKEYFISIGGEKIFCHDFDSPESLHEFCKKDRIEKYFIIGKNFELTDLKMNEKNLPFETLNVFKMLFPFYEAMIHRLN